MDFTVEFYETANGNCPLQVFLDDLETKDPDDFAVVLAGLAKLKNRQYHREPLCKPLGEGLFELRHVGKLNTRVIWFFMKGQRLFSCTEFATRDSRLRSMTCIQPKSGCETGSKGRQHEKNKF